MGEKKTKEVKVRRSIVQVWEGLDYKGTLEMGGVVFDWKLGLTVSIDQLNDHPAPENSEDVRKLFAITLSRNNVEIELTNEEFGFFLRVLAELAIGFYARNEEVNKGSYGKLLCGMGPAAEYVMSASLGGSSTGTYSFPAELCTILSAPKFGCSFEN